MLSRDFDPATAAAVVLGASRFESEDFQDSDAFRNSADGILDYLGSELKLPPSRCLNLFNDDRSAPDQLKKIAGHFSDADRRLKLQKRRLSDIIVYYVGHGAFEGNQNDYFLSIQKTNEISPGQSSIRIYSLAKAIKLGASRARRYIFLDCCFAGAASKQFQGDEVHVALQKTKNAFPKSGTALFCAASARDPAMIPEGGSMTMFTDGLLDFLSRGYQEGGPLLTLDDLALCLPEVMREKFGDEYVRPELHLPDQRHGNLNHIGIFPNRAKKQEKVKPKPEPISQPLKRASRGTPKPRVPPSRIVEKSPKRHQQTPDAETTTTAKRYVESGGKNPLAEQVWHTLPKDVRDLVLEYQRESRFDWMVISGIILLALITYFAVPGGALEAAFSLSAVIWAIGLLCIGFAIAARFRRRKPARLTAMDRHPEPWELLEIMEKLRDRKSILLFGRFSLRRWHLWLIVVLSLPVHTIFYLLLLLEFG